MNNKFLKGLIIVFMGIIVLLTSYWIIDPWKVERVCFGDVCPDNGGVYLFYRAPIPEFMCKMMGKYPVVGFGWSRVYEGCSPFPDRITP